MIQKFILVLLSMTFTVQAARASSNLVFPVERNHIQIFPQRFEYKLINKDEIQLGDLLIDTSQVKFQLISGDKKSGNSYRFRFQWPTSLLSDGSLVIRDNVGKAIWTSELKKDLKKKSQIRNRIGFYDSTAFDESLIQKLQYTAFFRFCIHKEDSDTRIFLCSKDLYLKTNDTRGWTVLSRDSFRKESYVEINGLPVDRQGLIYLNERTDTISMRVLMLSGATLEIGTRKKEIDFKDVVFSDDEKQIIVRAKGTEPVDESQIKRFGPQDWETSLPAERPVMYLKGEGEIPLRQEFLIKGAVRKDNIQVAVSSGLNEQTYESSVDLEIKKSLPELRLTPENHDSQILNADRIWRLKNLEKGQINRRYLNVSWGESQFQALAESERGYAFEASSQISFPLFLNSELQWWQNNFRTGLRLQYEKILSRAGSDPDWSRLGLIFDVRFPKALRLKDSAWGAGAFLDSAQADRSLSLAGLHLFREHKDPPYTTYFQWLMLDLKLPLMVSGSDNIKLKTSYDLKANLRHFWNSESFWEIGVRLLEEKFESDGASFKISKTFAFAGIGLRF